HAHLTNQIDDLSRHGRPALRMTTLPAPVQPESSPMPGNHCFGLDDHKGRSPTVPELREPSPEYSICDAELYFVGTLRTLKDQKLMTEGQDLRVECSSAPEALPNRMKERKDDLEHVAGNVPGSSLKFNWFNQYGVFGRDRLEPTNCLLPALLPYPADSSAASTAGSLELHVASALAQRQARVSPPCV